MNKETQIKITLLKGARERLVQRRNIYICTAIDDYVYDDTDDHETEGVQSKFQGLRDDLKLWIMGMLHPWTSYGGWLRVKHPHLHHSSESHREARIQWIDWMINELEK